MYPVSEALLEAVKQNTRRYYWTGKITTKAGTEYEFGAEYIEALPNGTETLSIYPDNGIETYRDVLYYIGQVLGGFFVINRAGELEFRKYVDALQEEAASEERAASEESIGEGDEPVVIGITEEQTVAVQRCCSAPPSIFTGAIRRAGSSWTAGMDTGTVLPILPIHPAMPRCCGSRSKRMT